MKHRRYKAGLYRAAAAVLVGVLQACSAPASREDTGRDGPPATSIAEKVIIRQTEDIGRMIYERDLVAAYASDLVLEKVDPRDYPEFVGWVTYPGELGYTVSFYERSGQGYGVVADVLIDQSAGSPVLTLEPEREPTETEVSMIRARIAALEHGRSSCSDRYNTVVVPAGDHWDVYVLAATAEPDTVQVGGHVRVSVAADTGDVLEVIPLSKSCLALSKKPDDISGRDTVAMLTTTRVVSELPSPVHVYLNLRHEVPLGVVTGRGMWIIEDGEIELHGDGDGGE